MKLNKVLLCLSMALSIQANAAINPKPISNDGNIQVIEYNKNQVVNILAKFGKVSLIQLEDDEVIDPNSNGGLGLGDKDAWSIDVRGNHIFLKPTSKSPDTNMLIVTNKRTYAFNLKAMKNARSSYIVRFEYPDTKQALEIEAIKKSAQVQSKLNGVRNTNVKKLNFSGYIMRGDKPIAPSRAWDDGLFTYFKYANTTDLPAIYKILPDGKEALVNTHVEGDTIVIQELSKSFMLRLGQSVLEIKNTEFNPQKGKFNSIGTSSSDLVRIEKGVAE